MAPLEEIADPTRTPNPAKAPWYFLGLQELVHYSALVGGVIVPTLIVLALLVLPYIDRGTSGSGRWFAPERRLANSVFTTLAVVSVVLTVIGTFFRGANWAWVWPWK
jgi:quinol-cytochrome oxidoreductase complex cytochrome b subunit